jgi:uncharacterized protein (TIGR02001 family)
MRAPRLRRRPEAAPATVRRVATVARRCTERTLAAVATAVALALACATCHAQVSGTLTALSDYRYRGVSFSDDRPAAQFTVAYDDPHGWYAGVFASTVRFALTRQSGAQSLLFAGYAHRLESGPTIEAGVDYATYRVGGQTYDYPEIYVGGASDNLSARLYYAHRYYAGDADTYYAELNGALAVHEHARLIAHLGALHTRGGLYYSVPDITGDAKAGVAFDIDRIAVQLAWVGVSSTAAYIPAIGSRRNNVMLSIALSF